jgi:purine-nucleoside phosphorylase
MEELIALGVTKFIAVGTAGTLVNHNFGEFIISSKALAEDGVAHHYLPKNENFSKADDTMLKFWKSYAKKQLLPAFTLANPWSFSAIFKENPLDITRVKKQGYSIVEMEAATLYAIGQEKGVKTLSLFVISDKVSLNEWATPNKEAIVKINLHKLADWALEFCKKDGLLIN